MTDLQPQGAQRHVKAFANYVRLAARGVGFDLDSPRGGGRTALSRATGMSQSSVGRMLAGKTLPDPAFFEPLATALQVPVADLLVLSGLVSEGAFGDAPERSAPTPRQAALDLGITDPSRIELFELMVRALLTDERDAREAAQR